MNSIRCKFLLAIIAMLPAVLYAQDPVVVVMGSSTAQGVNASTYANSWAGKLEAFFNQNNAPGNPDTVFYNIAVSGQTTWHQMPDGWTNLPSRPGVSPTSNVTEALSYNPDIVIINLPTNDVSAGQYFGDYNISETMDNFRVMFQTVTGAGARCFIASSQPRNDLSDFLRERLRRLRDSVMLEFGAFAIDFWTDLVTPTDNELRDEVRDPGSDYHLNNTGHNLLYLRVAAADIFSAALPVRLQNFSARTDNRLVKLNWNTLEEDGLSAFTVERSSNGNAFEILQRIPGNGEPSNYEWVDERTEPGRLAYRLKIEQQGGSYYSKTVFVNMKSTAPRIERVFREGDRLNVTLHGLEAAMPGRLIIFNTAGQVLYDESTGSIPVLQLQINARFKPGTYIISFRAGDHAPVTRAFNW